MSNKSKIIIAIITVAVISLTIVGALPKCDICDKIGAFNNVDAVTTWKLCNECYDNFNEKDNSYDNNYSYSKNYSYSSFTNKYGTSTTKCAHSGCSNYIASSGDTNCCTTHSRRCIECNCYIDEDANWCMKCIEDALK